MKRSMSMEEGGGVLVLPGTGVSIPYAYLQGHWRQGIAKKSPRPALTSFWLL